MADLSPTNGPARRWEHYALSLLSGLLGLLWILFWDMRQELTAVRRVTDERTGVVQKVGELHLMAHEQEKLLWQRGLQLAVIEREILTVQGQLSTHGKVLEALSLQQRLLLSKLTGGPPPDEDSRR